jgi:hypothetical protein
MCLAYFPNQIHKRTPYVEHVAKAFYALRVTTNVKRPNGCLPPIGIDHVVDEPELIRDIARNNGPYFMPARYLIGGETAADARKRTPKIVKDAPAYLIGPTWRGDWAFDGEVLVEEAAPLLHHQGFIDAAQQMFDAEIVVPEQVYVNLSTPMGAQPFSHVDIPEFIGVNRHNAPGWFLQAMGSSGLFEDVRISIITAVAWFHQGERGFFRYWPEGRENNSVRHENMWNTAVVGDNDFMHHLVERNGPKGAVPPEEMSINTELNHDGVSWNVLEQGEKLASYGDLDVRLSLSWKAKVYSDKKTYEDSTNGIGNIGINEAIGRFNQELGSNFSDLSDDELRQELSQRWSGYVL